MTALSASVTSLLSVPQIPFIRRAQQMSPLPLRLFASPWAPPAWMKDNHKVNESGALIGAVGGAYYEAWAQYFVRFLDAYRREHDISFWGLTAENEPLQGMLNKRHPFNCLNLSAESEAAFVARNLGPALRTAGYGDLVLLVYDDAGKEVKEYAEAARVAAAEFVGGVAFHWYANDVMKHGFPDSALDSLHALYPDWLVINSEACHLKGLGVGDWQYGLRYAFDVIRVRLQTL
jgi:glucosylceramidase